MSEQRRQMQPKQQRLSWGQVSEITGYSMAEIAHIRSTSAPGADPESMVVFLTSANARGVDPMQGHINLIPRGGRGAQHITINGLRARADASGVSAGSDPTEFRGTLQIKHGKEDITVPEVALHTVYKMVAGQRCGYTGQAYWAEFYPGPGAAGEMYRKMPYRMLAKDAEAQALSMAFASVTGAGITRKTVEIEQVMAKARTKALASQYERIYGGEEERPQEPALPEPEDLADEEPVDEEPQVDEWARYRELKEQALQLKLRPRTLRNETPLEEVREYNDVLGEEIEQAFMQAAQR